MRTQKLPEEYLKELGHRIKLVRTFLKLDQKQMSVLMETAQSQLSKIEAGRTAPSIYQLFKIKKAADENVNLRDNLSWGWLLEGTGKGLIG